MLYTHFTEELLGLQGVKIRNVEKEENNIKNSASGKVVCGVFLILHLECTAGLVYNQVKN